MSVIESTIKGTIKGVVSTIPGVSLLASIADEIQNGILYDRFEDWKETVESRLQILTDIQIEQLKNNQLFATVLLLSAQLAIKTNKLKRDYLANAVLNSATTTLSEDRVVILLNCMEKYTIEHFRLLRFIFNPRDYNPRESLYMCSPLTIYDDYYPNRSKELDRIIIRDLYADGLSDSDSLSGTMTLQGCLTKRTTPLGDDMIEFFKIEKIEE